MSKIFNFIRTIVSDDVSVDLSETPAVPPSSEPVLSPDVQVLPTKLSVAVILPEKGFRDCKNRCRYPKEHFGQNIHYSVGAYQGRPSYQYKAGMNLNDTLLNKAKALRIANSNHLCEKYAYLASKHSEKSENNEMLDRSALMENNCDVGIPERATTICKKRERTNDEVYDFFSPKQISGIKNASDILNIKPVQTSRALPHDPVLAQPTAEPAQIGRAHV